MPNLQLWFISWGLIALIRKGSWWDTWIISLGSNIANSSWLSDAFYCTHPSTIFTCVRIHRSHGLDWKEANQLHPAPDISFFDISTSLCGNRVLPSQELSCLATFRKTPTCACDWGSAAHALSSCCMEKDWTPISQLKLRRSKAGSFITNE